LRWGAGTTGVATGVYEGTVRYCLKNTYSVSEFAGISEGAWAHIKAVACMGLCASRGFPLSKRRELFVTERQWATSIP
jgi:hypothetical protein